MKSRFASVLTVLFIVNSIASAGPTIDRQITVQPILVVGATDSLDVFEAETDKIWAQAGIDVKFLPLNYLNDPTSLVLNSTSEVESFFASAGGASADPGVINVWFTDVVVWGAPIAGLTNEIGGNKILITEYHFDWHIVNILGHELGHSLDLEHLNDPWDYGNMLPDHLMSSFMSGAESIDDIYPDGSALARLTAAEIELARLSPYVKELGGNVVPTPDALLLAGAGLGFVGCLRRRFVL